MKKLLIIIISLHFFNVINAQDIIIQTNGDEIKAKVLEISDVIIKYHKYENLTGPVYSINKSEVFMIKYENGTKDVFGKNEPKQEEPKKVNPPPEIPKQEKPKTSENITLIKGRYYYHDKMIGNKDISEILKTNASPEIFRTFNKGYKNRMISDVLSYVDLGIIGTAIIIKNRSNTITPAYQALVFTAIGIICVGVPLSIVGSSQKKKSIIKYNNSLTTSYKPELYFGVTQNGVGLILKF